MGFFTKNEKVTEGDTVILFISVNAMHSIDVVPTMKNKYGHSVKNVFNSSFGCINVMDLVGLDYGSRLNLSKGWAWILHPTCELWTKTLPHRTQIIYTPDISAIIMGLDLKQGSIVVEAGTGSGSLSHAIIRTVQPGGHLYTFDFHEERTKLARDDFNNHGLSQWVTVQHRDVVMDGFLTQEQNFVDGIFLDLPCPWEVIPHIKKTLKRGGKLCTFSPCIEQVQKTCEGLRKSQCFILIRTLEVLQRPMAVQTRSMTKVDFSKVEPVKGVKLEPMKREQSTFLTCCPQSGSMPGHTGFVTFATFAPLIPNQ